MLRQYPLKQDLLKQDWAKQTGLSRPVKAALALTVAALAFSGCSTDHWFRTDKTPHETAADYKACNDRVQEMALARAGQQRASYTPTTAARPPNGLPTGTGANVGETPMQMHDRVTAETNFDAQVRTCMTDKGYTLAP